MLSAIVKVSDLIYERPPVSRLRVLTLTVFYFNSVFCRHRLSVKLTPRSRTPTLIDIGDMGEESHMQESIL